MCESVISASCHHLYQLKVNQLKYVYSEADFIKAKLTNQLPVKTNRNTKIRNFYKCFILTNTG